jgi:AmpD protein
MNIRNAAMHVDPATGLLDAARQCPSPNRDARPDSRDLTLAVIHGISLPPGEFGGDAIDRLFTNTLDPDAHPYFREIADLRVSAHMLIRRDGELVQYVPFHERAWHAGRSCWGTREACNDFAIGIELEGTDHQAYEAVQYERLAGVVTALATAYPRFDPRCLAGHCDVAPGRKTDPGPTFDWRRLDRLLGAEGRIAGSSAG